MINSSSRVKALAKSLLVIIFLQTISPAFAAIDKDKLMKLDPLPSARMKKLADNTRDAKIFSSWVYGLAGLALIFSSTDMTQADRYTNQEAYRDLLRSNQVSGGMFIILGLSGLFMPTLWETDVRTLNEMNLQPAEKEIAAYYKMKSLAEEAKSARTVFGLGFTIMGLGTAAMSSNFETSSSRSTTLLIGSFFAVMGILSYCLPMPIEAEVKQMDDKLMVSFPVKL